MSDFNKSSITQNTVFERMPSQQAIFMLQQHYPNAQHDDLQAICLAVEDSRLALQLIDKLLQQYTQSRFSEPQDLLAELYLPVPVTLFENTDVHDDEQDLAFRINNLGRVLQDHAKLEQAKQCFALALCIDEARYGADHPYVARDSNKLGTVLHDMGQLHEAGQAFERALAIDEAHYGSNHPHVARDANNLAILMRDSGDLAQAYELFQWALSICENTLGVDHTYTKIVQNHVMQLESELYF